MMTTAPDWSVLQRETELMVREYRLAPKAEPPWHRHTEVTDLVYVVRGRLQMETEGASPSVLGPGDHWLTPPGATHRLRNVGRATSTFLFIQSGGGCDSVVAAPEAGGHGEM